MNAVKYHEFEIPRKLVWKTGTEKNFVTVSEGHISDLKQQVGIDQNDAVLEIGCGVGRDAIALTKILSEQGKYTGIDIIKESIDWAKNNISNKYNNFEFVHFDVKDNQHNPHGTETMKKYNIPLEDSSTDLIFLFSVFTHMFPDDLNYYLSEFSRVLKPGKKVYSSMFLVNRAILNHLQAIGGGGLRKLTFSHEVELGFFHNDPSVVPGATAYSVEKIEEISQKNGLKVHKILRGSWNRYFPNNDIHGQDAIILQKI